MNILRNRLIRLFISAIITTIVYGVLVGITPNENPSRILVMLGGQLPAGLIQAATFFLFVFGMLELFWLNSHLSYEKDAYSLHLLPEKENWVLSADDVAQLKLNIQKTETNQKFYLTDLVKKCCTKYRLSKDSSEVLSLSEAQIKVYQEKMESEQSFVRYVAWAIPSVGFIGTVWGIAASLGYAKEAATEAGIAKVTMALAVAFDTTLVALVLSIFLMYAMHSFQKKQDAFFSNMSNYIIENLINRFYK
jgi:chemotaxis protein MotA